MKTAFVFPGQGAQKVGMIKDLYDNYAVVKELFEEADDALHFSLTKLIFEGPDEELMKTSPIYKEVYDSQNKGGGQDEE